jgi:hypothetical protein
MHSAFLAPGSVPTVLSWFVDTASWREGRAGLDRNARAFVEASGFESVATPFLPGRTNARPRVPSGRSSWSALDDGAVTRA